MNAEEASLHVKSLAREAGFDVVAIAAATDLHVERGRYLAWIAEGRHGEMRWIDAEWVQRCTRLSDKPEVHSVVSVGMGYWAGKRPPVGANEGLVARYAWGTDYHQVLGERLQRLTASLIRSFGGHHAWYVDTGPAMDKALAARAGLGFYGKNTNLLTETLGSFVLLGEVLTSVTLAPDSPLERTCGSCRLCVRACPTDALGPDYSIDSRKCISYLTIEHRGPIPVELRPLMGNWVFGCDICQDVCPPTMRPYLTSETQRREWARDVRSTISAQPLAHSDERSHDVSAPVCDPFAGAQQRSHLDLLWLLRLSHADYLQAFRGTSIRRAKVWMLRRNAAVALGNVGACDAVEPLVQAMLGDEHPIVRSHAAWALGQLGLRCAVKNLIPRFAQALTSEQNPDVRTEIFDACRRMDARHGMDDD